MNHRPAFAYNRTKFANRVALLLLYSKGGGKRGRAQRFANSTRAGVRGCKINRFANESSSRFVTIANEGRACRRVSRLRSTFVALNPRHNRAT